MSTRSLYGPLSSDLSLLNLKWHTFLSLYGRDEDRIALLNKTAPVFFAVVQDLLTSNVLMGLSRLTDPSKSQGKDNLSIETLIESLADPDHSALRQDLESRLDTLRVRVGPFRTWRHKSLAHRDLEVAIGAADLLPTIQHDAIDAALSEAAGLLNHLALTLWDESVRYEFKSHPRHVDSLIHYLQQGRTVELERRAELEARLFKK